MTNGSPKSMFTCASLGAKTVLDFRQNTQGAPVMIAPPFANNTTLELFDETIGRVVGYVFASSGSGTLTGSGTITQEQRWVLYADYVSPPGRSVVLRRPTDAALQFQSLTEFRNALRTATGGIWRDGAKYVKVNAQ